MSQILRCIHAFLLALLSISTLWAQPQQRLQSPVLKDEVAAAPVLNFADLAGHPHTLTELRGRVVLLNLWGTWCGECVLEMPSIEKLSTHFKHDPKVVILLVSFHSSKEEITAFRRKHHSNAEMFLLRNDDLPKRLQLHAFPETFLLGKDGRLRAEHTGVADWSSAPVVSRIEALEREQP